MPTRPESHEQQMRRRLGRKTLDRESVSRRRADPRQRAVDQIRNTNRWRRLRRMKLAQCPLCQDCAGVNRIEPATQVHHDEPLSRRPDLAFTMTNLVPLCTTCHARREAEARKQR